MLKYKHFKTKNFYPELHADIVETGKWVQLQVFLNYSKPHMQIVFSKEFITLDAAIDIMKGFSHGFEYTGAKWVEIKPDDEKDFHE